MESQLIPTSSSSKEQKIEDEYYLDYEVKKITPVVVNWYGTVAYIFLSIITAGIFALSWIWMKKIFKWMRYRDRPLDTANRIFLVNEYGEEDVVLIERLSNGNEDVITIKYRYSLYYYDPTTSRFIMVRNYMHGSNAQIRELGKSVSETSLSQVRIFHGFNTTRISISNPFVVFIEEALSFFNFYQMFAVVVWWFRKYEIYAFVILGLTLVTMIYTSAALIWDQVKINRMVDILKVVVHRMGTNGQTESKEIDSIELIPGDMIEVPTGVRLPCDLILYEGQCLVDESALTGESVPMHKTQLPATSTAFSYNEKGHILYAGTIPITSDSLKNGETPATAVVYQTGFNTTKGLLIRSIMFNNPGLYRFEKDGNWFVLILILISFCFIATYYGMIYGMYPDSVFAEIALPSVDIMLTMVPPGLILCLSVGTMYAQMRLSYKKIMVLKNRLINAAGRMKVVFFDKTGTLTVNKVNLVSVYISDLNGNREDCTKLEKGSFRYSISDKSQLKEYDQMLLLNHFATNHTLVQSKAGLVLGDPLEDELFNFAETKFSPSEGNAMKTLTVTKDSANSKQNVVEIFGFKPELQRMSVVVQDPQTKKTHSFIKGAPEKIIQLCNPQSLPANINKQVSDFAKQGYRVIGFASVNLTPKNLEQITRESSEEGADFQGLALFTNPLKEQTKPTLNNLKKFNFVTGMITGDNINTAISISKTCGLVDVKIEDLTICTYVSGNENIKFQMINEHGDTTRDIEVESLSSHPKKIIGAIDSVNFAKIVTHCGLELTKDVDLKFPVLNQLAEHIRVFARMNPEQKALIVKIMKTFYKDKYYTVGYCGDGANDCIALKHADIGVSLSKTEASLSAPFVSTVEDISCIEVISIQGKAALTSNYDIFRYFCQYSIIQTIGLLFLFNQNTEYSIPMYITMDVPMALNIANCIGLIRPITTLTKKMPKYTLINWKFIASMVINSLLTVIWLVFALIVVRKDPFFVSASDQVEESLDSNLPTFESTVISIMVIQGTFHIALSFCLAGTFKKRFFQNVYICVSSLVYQLFNLYLIYNEQIANIEQISSDMRVAYNFVVLDPSIKGRMVALIFTYSLASLFAEALLIWVFTRNPFWRRQKPDAKNEKSAQKYRSGEILQNTPEDQTTVKVDANHFNQPSNSNTENYKL